MDTVSSNKYTDTAASFIPGYSAAKEIDKIEHVIEDVVDDVKEGNWENLTEFERYLHEKHPDESMQQILDEVDDFDFWKQAQNAIGIKAPYLFY